MNRDVPVGPVLPHACCDLHGYHCEPPSELCCRDCVEAAHPDHPHGVLCVLDAFLAAARSRAARQWSDLDGDFLAALGAELHTGPHTGRHDPPGRDGGVADTRPHE